MKNNLRGKIREFLASEEGKVGVKTPLTVGVVTGSLFLAQAIMAPTSATAWQCQHDWQCDNHPHICSLGTCVGG